MRDIVFLGRHCEKCSDACLSADRWQSSIFYNRGLSQIAYSINFKNGKEILNANYFHVLRDSRSDVLS